VPKKTKTMSKQAKGWITRRARMNLETAVTKNQNQFPVVVKGRSPGMTSFAQALKNAPGPMTLLEGPLHRHQSFSADPSLVSEIRTAARKKDADAVIERILERHMTTVVTDTRDEAWRMHHRILIDQAARRRERIISDFMAIGHRAQVTMVGMTTMTAILEVLEEAGYSANGRRRPDGEKNADTNSVR
jgi:hypothetical protein